MKIEISDTQKVKKIIIEFDDETSEPSELEVIEKTSNNSKSSKPSKKSKSEHSDSLEPLEPQEFLSFDEPKEMSEIKVSKEVLQKPEIKNIENRAPKVSSTMQNLNI